MKIVRKVLHEKEKTEGGSEFRKSRQNSQILSAKTITLNFPMKHDSNKTIFVSEPKKLNKQSFTEYVENNL